MSTQIKLADLGDRLEQAFTADLLTSPRHVVAAPRATRPRWLRTRKARWIAALISACIAAPGVAYAAGAFTSPQTVARSLTRGAVIFGSHSTCTVIHRNVEYQCTLAQAPPPDPVGHLSAAQWRKLLGRAPGVNKLPTKRARLMTSPGHWKYIQVPKSTTRLGQLTNAYRDKVLAEFGFTTAQIKAHDQAVAAGAAGINAGHFDGVVEPIVNASHHVDGGCRAINPPGTRWDCYLGKAAVAHKVVGDLGAYSPGPGVG